MKILVPTADYPPIEGGISTVARHVSRELAAMGHEVTVLAPYFADMAAFDAAEPVRVVRYRGYGLGWLRFFPLAAATAARARTTDLILGINIAYGGVLGYLNRLWRGTPYVTFAYAYEFLKFRRDPILAALLRHAYAHARVTIAVSDFTRDRLVEFGVAPEQIETILPGAPPIRTWSEDEMRRIREKYVLDTSPVILSVGRLVRRKGHVNLVRALPRILERFPDAVLVLVGRGPCTQQAAVTAGNLGLREHVLLPGCVPDEDLAGLYQAADVFALPTGRDDDGQVEGFGLVFAEAQAYGKPVVAGRSGGVAEAVLDGETGLLVEPGDPNALADAILAVLADPALARRLGENGRRRVETELNWTRFAQRLMDAVERRA